MTKHADLSALEKTLGHKFQRRELLEQSLTHSSHANEAEARLGVESDDSARGAAPPGPAADNEQLEFLGDAVLGFVTSTTLFERFPGFHEGQLSKLRAHLVSARHLIEVANRWQLGTYLRLGRGEENSGGRHKSALLVNALEATLAAVYLDAGLAAAASLIMRHILEPELDRVEKDLDTFISADYKSSLQEMLQKQNRGAPLYTVVEEQGPDHRKTFVTELRIAFPNRDETEYVGRAQASSKKRAEQLAAKAAVENLQRQNHDLTSDQSPAERKKARTIEWA